MREIDLVRIASQGWRTAYDPVTPVDLSIPPEIQNFSPFYQKGALTLDLGYARAGLGADPVAANAVVCLFGAQVLDLTSGVSYYCVIYSANGILECDQLGVADAYDGADGDATYPTAASPSNTQLIAAGAVSDTYWKHCICQNRIYVFNNEKSYVIWRDTTWQIDELDAVACTDPPPAATMPVIYLGRMWVGSKRTMYYSEVPPDT